MQFVVENYSVIMIVAWTVSCSLKDVTDLSCQCIDNRILRKYLTAGKETSDYSISLVANEESFNCTIMYNVQEENFIMLVLEFLDWMPGRTICSSKYNSIIVASSTTKTEVCSHLDVFQSRVFRQIGKANVNVTIGSAGNLTSVKIIATAMKYTGVLSCSGLDEIECAYENVIYCMTRQVICDEHINCGVSGWFDENLRMCKDTKLTPTVVIFTIIMTIVTTFLVISILMVFMPKRRKTFIYKIDGNMSLFDCDYQVASYEISLHVVFPGNFPAVKNANVAEQHDSVHSVHSVHRFSSLKEIQEFSESE